MNSNAVHKKITHFASKRKDISLAELKDMVLTWYEPFRIYTTKLSGRNMTRDMYSTPGPSGDAVYDYEAMGYMVLYDEGRDDYRTIVWDNVTKIVKDGTTYIVR